MFRIKFPTKKSVGAYVYPPSRMELRGTKNYHVWNIIMCKNGKVDLLYNKTLQKILITSKNGLYKNCSELNSVQKMQQAHMSISLQSGARGLQRLPYLKYCNVWEWEGRFTLQQNAAKNTDYIQKLFRIKFHTKYSWGGLCLSPFNKARVYPFSN